MRSIFTSLAAIALTACAATGTGGPVKIGPDTYMIGGLGGMLDHSSSVVKAKFFKQASDYCTGMGRDMTPINSVGKDAEMNSYASAEVQFRCTPKP